VMQLTTPQAGRLMQLLVDEGQTVQPGDLLAVVDVAVHSDQGNTAALLTESLQARSAALGQEARNVLHAAQQREQALRDRLRSLRLDVTHADGELEAVVSRQALAQQSLSRDETLAGQGFLSTAQVQTRQAELLDLKARERQARRNLEALRREAQSVGAEIEAVRLQANVQQAQLDRIRAGIAQEGTEIAARSLLHLTASTEATVGAVAVRPGHSLLAGQAVLSLLPTQRSGVRTTMPVVNPQPIGQSATVEELGPTLQAQLYAPSRSAGFVAPGQSVWMRLQAFPYQKFGMLPGRVIEVSRTPVQPQDLPAGMAQALLTAAEAQEPLYRITVALQRDNVQAFGNTQPLKAGMILEADVVQDRRAIWEWVLEPLLAAKSRWQIPSIHPVSTRPGGV
jgi:membrane fusion protein